MKKKLNRLLALALAVMMAASALPVVGARAEEENVTWVKVTEDPGNWSGEYIIVYEDSDNKAVVFNGGLAADKIDTSGNCGEFTISPDETISAPKSYSVSIEAQEEGYLLISNSGLYLYSTSSSTNKTLHSETDTEAKSYPLTISFEDGETTVAIASSARTHFRFNPSTSNGRWFRFFKAATYTSQKAICLYKLNDGPVTPKVKITGATPASGSTVAPSATVKITTDPADATVQYAEVEDGADLSFKDAVGGEFTLPEIAGTYKYKIKATYDGHDEGTTELTYYVKNPDDIQTTDVVKKGATGEQFKVKGVVTFIDGRNIYVQDEKGGICAYPDAAVDGLQRGDVVTATGSYKVFNKLPELEKATVVKTDESTPALSATEKTIDGVIDADVCTYVTINGAKVTKIDGKNITINDGKEIQIYNAPAMPEGLAVGDTVTVTAAVGTYNKLQLRTMVAEDIEITEYAAPAAPTAVPESGSQVESGTEITVTSATAGATIEQSTDYVDDAETATWSTVEGGKLTVNGEVGAEVKFYVRAKRMAGSEPKYSDVVTLKYTVKEAEEKPDPTGETWVKVTEDKTDWSGKYLLVYENSDVEGYVYLGGAAEESTLKDKTNHSVATIVGGTISSFSDKNAIYIEKSDNGNYVLKTTSGYYLYPTSNDTIKLIKDKATAADYALTISIENGEIKIHCDSASRTLRYNDGYFRFYASGYKPVALYEPGQPAEPEGLYEPQKGDTVVIFSSSGNQVMTATAGSKGLNGVAATVSGTKLTADKEPAYLTVDTDESGNYLFTTSDGKYLNGSNDNKASLGDKGDFSLWKLEEVENEGWMLNCVNAEYNGNPNQYLEFYNGQFYPWSYSEDKDKGPYTLTFYKQANVTVKEPEVPEEPEESGYEPKAGDEVVIFNPNGGVVMTGTASGTRLKGAEAKEGGGKLFMADGTDYLLLTVGGKEDAYTFTSTDNKVLSTADSGNTLTLSDAESAVNSTWKLEKVSGGYIIRSVGANYNGNHNQAIEYYTDGNFNTYGYKDDNDSKFVMRFYTEANIGKKLATNTDIEDTIAQWGGGGPYDDGQKTEVKGDLYKTGDMLDEGAKFTVVANGDENAKPYQRTNGSGSTAESPNYNYYMGGEKIGTKSGDYMQFALSTKGYGDMTLSFRMRVTGAGAKDYTLQYSTDGNAFSNFENGKYSYAYHKYNGADSGEDVSGSGDCKNGVASIPVDSQYISYTFTVPVGAENADRLLIRLVPGDKKISGTGTIGGNVRIDSVKLVGSPIVDDSLPGYVVAEPDGQEEDVPAGSKIALTASNEGSTVKYRFARLDGSDRDGEWLTGESATLPTELPIALEIKAVKDGAEGPVRRLVYQAGTVEAVKMSPNGGGVYLGADGTAQIVLSTNTAGAEIWYRTNLMKDDEDGDGKIDFVKYGGPIELRTGFGTLTVDAYATMAGLQDSAVITRTFTERGQDKYELYFGQMHSHTSYSDGSGSPQEAFDHVMGLSQKDYNMDFLSLTDHSNSFDGAGSNNTINDAPSSTEWKDGKALAASVTKTDKFVGIFGYEMTWSNGLGHINTFNTTGFQDRTQSAYTTYSTALQNYYEMLKTAPDSISQFNHPGTTFGDFSDFAHYDAEIDQLITLIEVGNGEGAIGSSGYFPSYEYYTRALDKGWHVAPTNNQDNHKGGWGSANNARDVVLVDELTEAAIYDAMRNYRVYATEDINLEIYYTFDGNIMGSRLEKSDVSDTATIRLELNDPNADDQAEATVQVIVNGGKVAEEVKTTLDQQVVEIKVPTTYNYYYIKVVEADGDIAVTAPVWVGAVTAVGVTSFEPASSITITDKEQTIDLELYNNEKKGFTVSSITYTDITGIELSDTEGIAKAEVIGRDTTISEIKKLNTASTQFKYTFIKDGIYTIRVTVTGTLDGAEMSFYKDMEITVMPAALVQNIIVDGTHSNDYVTGYYGGNMGNMTAIAANNAVQVTVVTETITPEMLANCSLLVLSAPAKKTGTANAGDYGPSVWDDAFIAMVKKYVKGGGNVIVTGLADYQDDKSANTVYQTSVQQNKLLAGIGSSMKINDDEVYDEVNNGGQEYRLYPEIFNPQSPWTAGIVEGQTYSQYSGCSVNPGDGTWLVQGFDTTYSIDSDKDGNGGIALGNPVYFLAHEQVGAGNVFAAGGVFLSDFEVKAELDNIWDLPYANRTIFENILHNLCVTKDVTPIADTRTAELNKIFTVEGYVTAGRENANNAFFDAIYIQDETGGTCVFPYSTDGLKLGTKVRVLGYTDAYQGDREIQVISLTVLNDAPVEQDPKEVTTAEAADYGTLGGQLLKVSGTVSNVVMASGRISQFDLTDSSGTKCTVFIDGYIWDANGNDPITGKLQAGATATAVGLSYLHPEGDSEVSVCVLRVRDCGEITFTAVEDEDEDETPNVTTDDKTENGETTTETTAKPDAVVSGGKASSSVSSAMGAEIVDQARKNGSDTVTIAPEVKKDVDSASVTIPGGTVKSIGERTDADLKVETPVGDVTIPNEALAELGSGGRVTVSAERDGDAVSVEITSGGETVESVPGGIRAALPLEDGQVAVLVDADGNETIIPKSVVEDGVTYVVLDGSATVKVVDNSVEFEDVSDDDWFVGSVDFASSHGLVNGVREASFAPGSDMTRAMLATVLWRLESEADAEGTGAFADVKSGLWYSEGVAWAGENGVINGTGNGNFEPERAVTRQEMAVMMYNYARFAGLDTTVGADLADFGDGAEVDSWAKDAMAWAVAAGLIRGTGAGLEPDATATRAQVVTVMERLVGLMVK